MKRVLKKPENIDKQIVFAEAYLANNRNATLAYKKTYGEYLSDEVAAVNASKLLRITKVKLYLQRRFDTLQLDSNYVLKNLKTLAENADGESVRLNANIWIGKAVGMFSESYVTRESEYDPEKQGRINEIIKKTLDRLRTDASTRDSEKN